MVKYFVAKECTVRSKHNLSKCESERGGRNKQSEVVDKRRTTARSEGYPREKEGDGEVR